MTTIFCEGSIWGRSAAMQSRSSMTAILRGGGDVDNSERAVENEVEKEVEVPFHEKVADAMKKLGLMGMEEDEEEAEEQCENGVCAMKAEETPEIIPKEEVTEEEKETLSEKLSEEMNIPINICRAAVWSVAGSEKEAMQVLAYEKSSMENIADDSEEVQKLLQEGVSKDVYQIRRALALTENNVDDARAVLLAEQLDEREMQQELEAAANEEVQPPEQAFKTVNIPANFDPTQSSSLATAAAPPPASSPPLIFNVSTPELQSLVLESPTPILLDVYAPWCGPCQHLTPILQDLVHKSNGAFRLAKLNSDENQPVCRPSCLDVKGLPTLIGIHKGRICNIVTGVPRTDQEFKSFLLSFISPSPQTLQNPEYKEKTQKLADVAGMAAIPFSAREALQLKTKRYLDRFYETHPETSLTSLSLLQKLLDNIIQNPYQTKYRTVKLTHPSIQTKITHHCRLILTLVGFQHDQNQNIMTFQLNQSAINAAPLRIVRDTVHHFILEHKRRRSTEERRLFDHREKEKLDFSQTSREEETPRAVARDDICRIKVRREGKRKHIDLELHPDKDTLRSVLSRVSNKRKEEEAEFICPSKKLIVSSHDSIQMNKSLRELGLMPSASVVVKFKSKIEVLEEKEPDASIKERSKRKRQQRKKGSHTMQSVGIYSKDDNAKGELIDGGGGVWYEHDVSDEEEGDEKEERDVENEEKKDGEEEE